MTPDSRRLVAMALQSCRSALIGVGLVSLIINVLMLTGPMFMLQVYDRVLTSRSVPTLMALAGIVLVLYAFFGLLDGLRSKILNRIAQRLDRRLSGPAFDRSVFLARMSGRKTPPLDPVRDLDQVRQFLSGPGPSALYDMPWMPIYLGVVFLFHPVLGVLATAGALTMCVLIGLNEVLAQKPIAAASAQTLRRAALVEGARANADAIRAMGMTAGLRRLWARGNEQNLTLQGSVADQSAIFAALIKTSRFVLQSVILGAGAYLAIGEAITPGILIAAAIITARAVAPIELAVSQWRNFVVARQGLRRLRRVFDLPETTPQTELPLPSRTLQVDGLSVTAPGGKSPLVQSIGFPLKAGDGLGIVGPSGSGKSTLGRALVGVWPAIRGSVRLDGAEIDQWDPERLGQAIGYLPQDVQLFPGSVAHNIARLDPEAPSKAIIAAAQMAGAHQMIASLPNGYDTEIGEGGRALSGGQKQRVALARALYGNPFLLVLDEPNSDLDAEGEAALTRALQGMRDRGSIVVVIAHRPSAIQVVDKLLFMTDGQMRAYGPRDEVLRKVLAASARGTGLKVIAGG